MRRKDESKKPIIADFINAFFYEHDKVPSVREIVEGTGIPLSTVHRYLVDMQEKGELSYNGYRSARTKEMSEVSPIHGIAVLGTVACGHRIRAAESGVRASVSAMISWVLSLWMN